MPEAEPELSSDPIVDEIVKQVMIVERNYAFERRNVATQRRSDLLDAVERVITNAESKS